MPGLLPIRVPLPVLAAREARTAQLADFGQWDAASVSISVAGGRELPRRPVLRVRPFSTLRHPHARAGAREPLARVAFRNGPERLIALGNPLPVACRVGGRLGRHHADGVLLSARSRGRWACVEWVGPTWTLAQLPRWRYKPG